METIHDVVEEMRTRSREVEAAFGPHPNGSAVNMLDIWADRIEAACERKDEFWRGRVKDAMDVADQFKGALDHVLNGLMFAQHKEAK